jgi:hypothetical protein
MSDESYLREKVRNAIRAGKLPNRQPDHIWGGPGSGANCAICEAALERDGVELEIQFLPDPRSAGSYRVHVECFAMFESERQSRRALNDEVERLREAPGSWQNPGRGSGAAY